MKAGSKGVYATDSAAARQVALGMGLVSFIVLQAVGFQMTGPVGYLTLFGGFLASLIYVSGLLFFSTMTRYVGYTHVVVSLLVAVISAAMVHRVCVSTGLFFSIGWTVYLYYSSLHIYGGK